MTTCQQHTISPLISPMPLAPSKASALLSGLLCAGYLLILSQFFEFRWETNDDVAMSMILHGYGIAAFPSPQLQFQNILWGHLLQSLPVLFDLLPYSLATLLILWFVGSSTIYFLLSTGHSLALSLLIFLFVITGPVLQPQFTINSALLALTSILYFRLFASVPTLFYLLLALLCAFLSFLIRDHAFLLMLGVACVALPWHKFRHDKASQVGLLFLLALMVAAHIFDQASYQTTTWQAHDRFNQVRFYFTDIKLGRYLVQQPELLKSHGFSPNDIKLISRWFFADPALLNSEKLQALVAALPPQGLLKDALQNGLQGISYLFDPRLILYTAAALLLAVLHPGRTVLLGWLLALAAFFSLGFIGRPGQFRVYVPVVALLLLLPMLAPQRLTGKTRFVGSCALLLLTAFHISGLFLRAHDFTAQAAQTRADLQRLPPHEVFVAWGDRFPFESAYPVLTPVSELLKFRIIGLNTSTLAPFSQASWYASSGNDVLTMLRSDQGISLVAYRQDLDLLRIYCKEHLQSELQQLGVHSAGKIYFLRLGCRS